MKIENENTFRKSFFLGSGFSVLAKDSEGRFLPTSGELLSELALNFRMPDSQSIGLSKLSTILIRSREIEFREYLMKRFTVRDFDPIYHNIENIHIKNIFTTNVDDLIYKIFEKSTVFYIQDKELRGPSFFDRHAIDYVPLHGTVINDNRPLTFSTIDIASAYHSDSDRWHALTSALQAHPTLFWGYSLEDSGTLEALNLDATYNREQMHKWIIIDPKHSDANLKDYYKALDFDIIESSTQEMLKFLSDISTTVIEETQIDEKTDVLRKFPKERIPEVGVVPVRPLIEFYLGSPPSWSDIYSGNIHRTGHFSAIENAIYSNRTSVVIGLAACGKTTLLMQLAANMAFDGIKLIFEGLTLERAKWMEKVLSNARALLFIDNFSDSIDAFNYLHGNSSFQLVGFDRDYNYDIVSHLMDEKTFNIINVTELEENDIQSIYSIIPTKVRSADYQLPQMSKGVFPSLFEIIENNIRKPSLKTRFKSVLTQLESTDKKALELLVLTCYVHRCRTPVSLDVLQAYYRQDALTYDDIFDICDRLGAMITDYYGPLADTEQEHFVPRSYIFSEAIIEQVSNNILRDVIWKFHKNVSRIRIPGYDVFKRRAYDADIMKRAFQLWEEGQEFYQFVYDKDSSPWILQQGAIYLSRKSQHIDAFRWIDRAVLQSGERIFSIRNSHAIILFRANIDIARGRKNDIEVRSTLDQSMEILRECYDKDRRKTYHVMVYTDQALRYYSVYENDRALGYLKNAKIWLEEEFDKKPWHYKLKRLLRLVTNQVEKIEGV
ncbi:MAG: SIR2 family protein [Candidatus Hodarchaeales archaeon]